jgi:hypothetical protein
MLSVEKEIPYEAGDVGYNPSDPNKGGVKMSFKTNDEIYNFQSFKSAKDTQELNSTTPITVAPTGVALASAYTPPKTGQAFQYDSADNAYYSVGKALALSTGVYYGDINGTTTNTYLNYPPTVAANKSAAELFGPTPVLDATLNPQTQTSPNAGKQFQDTVTLATRKETVNASSKTPNDFNVVSTTPEQFKVFATRGAGDAGTDYTGVCELALDLGASTGSETLTVKRGDVDTASQTLLSLGKDSTTISNSITAITMNVDGISMIYDGVTKITYNDTSTIFGDLATNSALILDDTPNAESLLYYVDDTVTLQSATVEPSLQIQKDVFVLGSQSKTGGAYGSGTEQIMYTKSIVDKAGLGLLYKLSLRDGADSAGLQTREILFNRTPNANLETNTHAPGMEIRSELPSIHLVSNNKTKHIRLVCSDNGSLYVQAGTSTAGSDPTTWTFANLVVDPF